MRILGKLGLGKLGLAAAAAALIGFAGAAEAGPVRVGHSTWVGNGPLYIARDKGYFAEEGVEFEDINIGDLKLRFAAAAAGEIDIILTTIDAMVLYLKNGDEYVLLTGADTSAGGDGIVATKDIKTIQDLKGKKVAFNEGSTSQFLLDVLLAENGMSEADVVPVNMDPGDAGAALIAGQVDAAVTWEPWLTKAKNSENAHILFDTTNRQDFITDFVMVRKEFLAEHPGGRRRLRQGLVQGGRLLPRQPEGGGRHHGAGQRRLALRPRRLRRDHGRREVL